jgi:predicted SAM-dependent methyltransferase
MGVFRRCRDRHTDARQRGHETPARSFSGGDGAELQLARVKARPATLAEARTVKRFLKELLGPALIYEFRLRLLQWRAARAPQVPAPGAPLYLHIGSGGRLLPGFQNLDLAPCRGAWRADISRRLPVPSDSVKGIFAEHVFEHLERDSEAVVFLAECRRVMAADARIRIVVPDAGRYLLEYASGQWKGLSEMRPLDTEHRDRWLGVIHRTRMELINAVFRQGREHKYAYDAETLIMVLVDAGFTDVRATGFGQGADPALLVDSPERASESLYVEAVNP